MSPIKGTEHGILKKEFLKPKHIKPDNLKIALKPNASIDGCFRIISILSSLIYQQENEKICNLTEILFEASAWCIHIYYYLLSHSLTNKQMLCSLVHFLVFCHVFWLLEKKTLEYYFSTSYLYYCRSEYTV